MSKFKILIIAGTIIAVAAILAIIYVVAMNNPATAPTVNSNTEDNQPVSGENGNDNQNPANGRVKYVNEHSGWSFTYPDRIFQQKSPSSVFLPYNNEEVFVEATFQHVIPVEYCDLSGKCQPNTVNMEFGVTEMLTTANRDFVKELQNSNIGSLVQTKKINDWNVYEVQLGAEGEGIVYYFMQKPNRPVFLAYHKYIDENTLINYQKFPNFIPIAEQSRIFDEIVKSIQ